MGPKDQRPIRCFARRSDWLFQRPAHLQLAEMESTVRPPFLASPTASRRWREGRRAAADLAGVAATAAATAR